MTRLVFARERDITPGRRFLAFRRVLVDGGRSRRVRRVVETRFFGRGVVEGILYEVVADGRGVIEGNLYEVVADGREVVQAGELPVLAFAFRGH